MTIARRNVVTTNPETPPPQLWCPTCEKPLVYRDTVLVGVQPPERYDRFACRADGLFEYRHRTRHLRAVADFANPHRVSRPLDRSDE
jgi:hypothetical protein